MRYVDEFRDAGLAIGIAEVIGAEAKRPVRLMEVCGTHTMAIARYGIRGLLPDSVRLISGPGCPVCVTPQRAIDRFIQLGRLEDVTLATFGDMVRVPGTSGSLETERANGADVRVVYSPMDAVDLARRSPDREVVFFGVGFETTTPAVALAVREAKQAGIDNFSVLCEHKTIPEAMAAIAGDPEVRIDGFLCPGHVSAIIGSDAYLPVANGCGIPCVISGFEPLDILQSILMLVRQDAEDRSEVEVQYSRAVTREGNPAARECVADVFEPCDADWRGLGVIPGSGLRFRSDFAGFDAAPAANELPASAEPPSICECGSILRGLKSPCECAAFGTACTPDTPLGPCMVSTEGACAAEYRYARTDE